MQSGARVIAGFAAVLSAVGCGAQSVNLHEGAREYVATDYESVLEQWTRTERLIDVNRLEDLLTVSATYESWDFRWAYAVRYAEDYRLTVEQRRALLDRSLGETHAWHQFYVALYAAQPSWANLKADAPAWIVRLIDDRGSETAPTDIEPIKKPGAIEKTYFPYTTPWRMAYRVRFAAKRADGSPTIAPDAHWFGLRFAGAQGYEELVWQLVSADGTPAAVSRRGSRSVAVR